MAHWFVSCMDRVNHPITKCYRRSDEVFCSAYIKIAFVFIYQEQACSAVNEAGQRARQEEERREVESVKCLIGTRDGGSHLTHPGATSPRNRRKNSQRFQADRAQTEPTQEQKTPPCFDSQELMKMMMKEFFQRKEEDRKWEKKEKPDSA